MNGGPASTPWPWYWVGIDALKEQRSLPLVGEDDDRLRAISQFIEDEEDLYEDDLDEELLKLKAEAYLGKPGRPHGKLNFGMGGRQNQLTLPHPCRTLQPCKHD